MSWGRPGVSYGCPRVLWGVMDGGLRRKALTPPRSLSLLISYSQNISISLQHLKGKRGKDRDGQNDVDKQRNREKKNKKETEKAEEKKEEADT